MFRQRDLFINLWKQMAELPEDIIRSFYGMKRSSGNIDETHPNVLGNCFIAAVYLKDIFGIEFDYKKYYQDVVSMQIMFPNYN